jgi:two-component system, sensor histidine kinase and response regulator
MKKILLIEDDKFVRLTTGDMLEAAGYVVISADNGRTGVQLALDSHPDLIICDILMPQLDGYAVLAALQKDPTASTIPFIFVTAKAEKSDLRLGMQLGADDYLVKPFTREELLGAIESRLHHHTVLAGYYTQQLEEAVSHELRTPLTSIKTAVSGLKDKVVDLTAEEQQDYLNLIDQEADRLEQLIGQILDQRRIEVGKLQTEKGLYFLPEIINATVDRLSRLPLLARHPVSTEFEDDLPLVGMDFIQIEQVLTNLLENAAKYSEADAAIVVRACRMNRPFHSTANPAQPGLQVEVVDRGMGVPEADLQQIFNRYYRGKLSTGSRRAMPSGLGLGLAIARSLIEAHEGEIWAFPNQDKGTTFAFWIPL